MKKFKKIKNILEFLGNTLVITGEVGLIVMGLAYLGLLGKTVPIVTFIIVFVASLIDELIKKRK